MRGVLLDTHVVLWVLQDSPRLGEAARGLVAGAPQAWWSAASAWELAIKSSLGKIELPDDLTGAVAASGLRELPVTVDHALGSQGAGLAHRDPFDSVLVAQARAERLLLVTADAKILGAWSEAVDART
ncbi:type II toxin-antitoxin system VapC family toxin [Nocardioides sp. YIM 152588]|uniref:type II toxin-antitoxin system VapC family toxin n=1 Tax=Nocardioides sp. YIM 152588 TaxID=3158259 RepID=UPI0032E49B2D